MNHFGNIRKFVVDLASTWNEEKPSRLAAALAYYGMFSFVPVVYIVIKVAGIFINDQLLSQQIFARLTVVLGPETARYIQDLVIATEGATTGGNFIATLVSFAALFYSASGLFTNLQYSLNTIWHVPIETQGGLLNFIKNRLLAFILVIGAGLVLVIGAFGSMVFSIIASILPFGFIDPDISVIALIALATLLFALIYKLLPEVYIAWRDVWLGSLITSVLVYIGGWALGFYFSVSGVGTAFEAAGALAIMLIGIYYIAQIFLSGAIFTRVYATTFGSKQKILVNDH
ncbi:YihY/virulence factor BrkB family protein [Chloroflexota bacterium]